MTIEKGQPWGRPGRLPDDGILVRSDAEARAVVEQARLRGEPIPPLGLLGGDLCRTLGGRGDEERVLSDEATVVTVDLASALVDGIQHYFVAHLVARRSWWKGQVVAVMNAEFLGDWDVAPRSHPNDGLLDGFKSDLSLDDRVKARMRLRSGTHVPHPGIREQRAASLQYEMHRPTPIYLDGVRLSSHRFLSIRVEPDALTCVI